jgi:hypothetical protein
MPNSETRPESGPLAAAWRLVWQTQQVLWWIYAVNLVLGLLSGLVFAMKLRGVLDYSLAAQRLYQSFDLAHLVELAATPDVQLAARPTSALGFAAIFYIFVLFATGGILDTYVRNRALVPGEFFQACGAFFWRFVRLLLWLFLFLALLGLLAGRVQHWSGYVSEHSAQEKLGFVVQAAGLAFVMLLLLIVRLWFDMAQVRAVIEDERRMTRNLGRAFRLTFTHFAELFWMSVRPSLLAWTATALALAFWIKLTSATHTGMSFLAGQFIAVLWVLTRLWQRASQVIWYQRHRPPALPIPVETGECSEPEYPAFVPEPPTQT